MKRNRKNKENQGITLIALIITVILLLILVGVSVNIIIKGNLFNNAQKAVDGTNAKVNEQQSAIDELMNELDEIEKDSCSHIWKDGETLLEPTCTVAGKKQKVCENCGKLLEVEIPALGHNFVNRVCTRCGEKEPGCTTHTYGEWVITKNATCVAEGSKKRTCTVCGVEEVETIPATGVHKWSNGKCSVCGETLVIGANINYHEYVSSSGGTLSASYTSTKTTRGSTDSSDSDATYSVVNNSGIQWIVLGEENGQIKITTKNIVQPTSGGYTKDGFKYLFIGGETGYSNFSNELNTISAVYGNGKYADTTKFVSSGGRSFKMEDLGYNSSGEKDSGSKTLPTEVSKANTEYLLNSSTVQWRSSAGDVTWYFVNHNGEFSSWYAYQTLGNMMSDISSKSGGVRPVVYLKSDIQLSYNSSRGYTISG